MACPVLLLAFFAAVRCPRAPTTGVRWSNLPTAGTPRRTCWSALHASAVFTGAGVDCSRHCRDRRSSVCSALCTVLRELLCEKIVVRVGTDAGRMQNSRSRDTLECLCAMEAQIEVFGPRYRLAGLAAVPCCGCWNRPASLAAYCNAGMTTLSARFSGRSLYSSLLGCDPRGCFPPCIPFEFCCWCRWVVVGLQGKWSDEKGPAPSVYVWQRLRWSTRFFLFESMRHGWLPTHHALPYVAYIMGTWTTLLRLAAERKGWRLSRRSHTTCGPGA